MREDRPRARDQHARRRSDEEGRQRAAHAVRPRVEDQADRRQARRAQGARGARRVRRGDQGVREGQRQDRRRRGAARATTTRSRKFAEADKDFEAYLDAQVPDEPQLRSRAGAQGDRREEPQAVRRVVDAEDARSAAARRKKYDERPRRSRTRRTRSPRPRASAQITQNFSDALFTAEIPKDVRTGEFADEKVEAFCDKHDRGRRAARGDVARGVRRLPRRSRPSSAGSATGRSCASASSARSSRKSSRRRPSCAASPTLVAPVIAVEPPISEARVTAPRDHAGDHQCVDPHHSLLGAAIARRSPRAAVPSQGPGSRPAAARPCRLRRPSPADTTRRRASPPPQARGLEGRAQGLRRRRRVLQAERQGRAGTSRRAARRRIGSRRSSRAHTDDRRGAVHGRPLVPALQPRGGRRDGVPGGDHA